MALQVGDIAPAFILPAGGGATIDLAALRGRKVVLFFYPKDDTSGCTQEAREFTVLRDAFEAANTVVIGVSPDAPAKHDRFAKKHGLDLLLASDEAKEVLQAYGVWAQKSMFGHRYMGVERTTLLLGPDGTIARIWSKVKVPNHAAEVLRAAQEL